MTKLVALVDRGLILIKGEDAVSFLQGLVTNDVTKAADGKAVFAGLLTPQGKINHEFFIVPVDEGLLLETSRGAVEDLLKRLTLYKMRSAITIEDLSDQMMSFWLAEAPSETADIYALYQDPRYEKMGMRALVRIDQTEAFCSAHEKAEEDLYHLARLDYGVPEGGYDYAYGDTFPHEAGYDLLNGVDFQKGCYVGQEVVSRMQHRGTARKRIVIVSGAGGADLPEPGSEIRTESSLIGPLGSVLGGRGLALVRLDRAAKALAEGAALEANGVAVTLSCPPWASYSLETEAS